MSPQDIAALAADRWFGALPHAHRALLVEVAQVRSVASGTRLYRIGDPPDGLWAVLDGQVRLVGYPAVGVELVVLIVSPGTWFGELSTLDGGPRPQDAVAFGPTRVLHITMTAFTRIAGQAPELYRDVALLSCAHQRASLAFIANNLAQPVGARLARALGSAVQAGGGSSVAIRQAEVAAMIGVSRQTLNKALKEIERAGAIQVGYGRITVVDEGRLRGLAAGRSG